MRALTRSLALLAFAALGTIAGCSGAPTKEADVSAGIRTLLDPPGAEADARTVNSDIDKGIELDVDAAFIRHQMHDNVKYAVKNGVVTLTGNVNSQSKRFTAGRVAGTIPHVRQVVNQVQVTDQKASSSH